MEIQLEGQSPSLARISLKWGRNIHFMKQRLMLHRCCHYFTFIICHQLIIIISSSLIIQVGLVNAQTETTTDVSRLKSAQLQELFNGKPLCLGLSKTETEYSCQKILFMSFPVILVYFKILATKRSPAHCTWMNPTIRNWNNNKLSRRSETPVSSEQWADPAQVINWEPFCVLQNTILSI